jgi:mannose-6-phosphate isomerase
MKRMFKMVNKIQDYEWGTQDYIAELIGLEKKDDKPWAELWMSSHEKAPSYLPELDMTLDKAIQANPHYFLSKEIAEKYNMKLPYLFKVLSSSKALSIQAHPNLDQAKTGYKKENELAIALGDYKRNYKDDNHKPELICALTDFHAMCGFRPSWEIINYLSMLDLPPLFDNFSEFKRLGDSASWAKLFNEILRVSGDKKQAILERVRKNLSSLTDDYTNTWIAKLLDSYPNDIGAISPLFLNTFMLKPGQAIFLEAGLLHAYLQGSGIEIMANSDNVLRGGLTPKNIDVDELTSILKWDMKKADIQNYPSEQELINYEIPISEFSLRKLNLHGNYKLVNGKPTMLLLVSGNLVVKSASEILRVEKGESIFLTGQAKDVELSGQALVFIASTGTN